MTGARDAAASRPGQLRAGDPRREPARRHPRQRPLQHPDRHERRRAHAGSYAIGLSAIGLYSFLTSNYNDLYTSGASSHSPPSASSPARPSRRSVLRPAHPRRLAERDREGRELDQRRPAVQLDDESPAAARHAAVRSRPDDRGHHDRHRRRHAGQPADDRRLREFAARRRLRRTTTSRTRTP